MSLSLREKSIGITSDLKRIVKGEVRFDDISRALYSTAACIFKIMPMGIVIPKDEEDVIKVVKYAYAEPWALRFSKKENGVQFKEVKQVCNGWIRYSLKLSIL